MRFFLLCVIERTERQKEREKNVEKLNENLHKPNKSFAFEHYLFENSIWCVCVYERGGLSAWFLLSFTIFVCAKRIIENLHFESPIAMLSAYHRFFEILMWLCLLAHLTLSSLAQLLHPRQKQIRKKKKE